MIGYVEGRVVGIIRDTVVVQPTGGPGLRIHTPTATLAKAHEGDTLTLWTHLAVRENAHDLFGFESKEELQWFELLLTVSGVGPRSALAILNTVDTQALAAAISANDASSLTRAFGVGRKTAEKVVLELKEKVVAAPSSSGQAAESDVVEALVALGYSLIEARDAARAIPKDLGTTEEKVREALRYASKS